MGTLGNNFSYLEAGGQVEIIVLCRDKNNSVAGVVLVKGRQVNKFWLLLFITLHRSCF
jgi:hypothetical protein